MKVANAYQASQGGNIDLGPGDPVKLVAGGTVAICDATDAIYGVVASVEQYYESSSGNVRGGPVLPGGTTWGASGTNFSQRSIVNIIPAKSATFEVDVDDTSASYDTEEEYANSIGKNVDISYNRAELNGSQRGWPKLDASGIGTDEDFMFRIVGVVRGGDNRDFAEDNIKLLVVANDTEDGGAPATNITGV